MLKDNFFHRQGNLSANSHEVYLQTAGVLICCLQYQLDSKYISKKKLEMKWNINRKVEWKMLFPLQHIQVTCIILWLKLPKEISDEIIFQFLLSHY